MGDPVTQSPPQSGRSKGQECGGAASGGWGLRTLGFGRQRAHTHPTVAPLAAWPGPAPWPHLPSPHLPGDRRGPGTAGPVCRGGQDSGPGRGAGPPWADADPRWGRQVPPSPPPVPRMASGQLAVCQAPGVVCSSLPSMTWIIPILLTRGSERLMGPPRLTQRSGRDEPQTQSRDRRGLRSSRLTSCCRASSSEGHACYLTSSDVRVTHYITSYSYGGVVPHMFLLLIDLLKSSICSLQRV